MRQELIQTLLPSKIKKLKQILDWATEHCNEEQLQEIEETLVQYNFLLTFPNEGMIRTTHEYTGRQDSIICHVPDNKQQAQNIDVKAQIRKRKQIINGFITEIEELKELTDQP